MMGKGRGILASIWSRLRQTADIFIPICLLAGALLVKANDPAPIQYLRNITFDTYQRLKPHAYNPELPVRIAAVDERSLKKFGQWPWPRTTLAMLINRLNDLGAATIGLDIMFIEADRSSPEQILEQLPDTADLDEAKHVLEQLPDNDSFLASAMRRIPTVLDLALTHDDPGRPQIRPAPTGGYVVAGAGDDNLRYLTQFDYVITPLQQLSTAAKGVGAANAIPDSDGVYRRVPLVLSFTGMPGASARTDTLVPTFSAELLRVATGDGSRQSNTYVLRNDGNSNEALNTFSKSLLNVFSGIVTPQHGIGTIRIGKSLIVPTTEDGSILLYDTGHVAQRIFSLADIMDVNFDRSQVEGRIILIGATVEGLNDLKPSPVTPNMPGVEFHAQAIEQALAMNLLQERPLIRPYWASVAEGIFLLVIGLVMILLIRRRGALAGLLLASLALASAIFGSWYLFSVLRFQVDPIYPSVTIFLIFVTGTMINFLRTENERRQIRNDFSLYLSPVMVDQLIQNPARGALGGEIRDLTVMFSDIRGFTKISESLDPQALTQLMNRYLTPMTNIIQARHGTIDKYIGDCIMAFWNAPLDVPRHGREAILTAFEMRNGLKQLNAEIQAETTRSGISVPELRAGIGLNSGPSCVGNMGSEQRKTYTVLGDTVNTASRLEALSASYGVDLVIGPETAEAAADFALLELDQVRVKGKLVPVRIFTALGDARMGASDSFRELRSRHVALLGAYRQCDWDLAAAALAACREVAPAELAGLYDLYAHRIDEFRRQPPPADWDGVYNALSKSG